MKKWNSNTKSTRARSAATATNLMASSDCQARRSLAA